MADSPLIIGAAHIKSGKIFVVKIVGEVPNNLDAAQMGAMIEHGISMSAAFRKFVTGMTADIGEIPADKLRQ